MLDLQEAYQREDILQTSDHPMESMQSMPSTLHFSPETLGSLAAHTDALDFESADLEWDNQHQAAGRMMVRYDAQDNVWLDKVPVP